MRPSSFAIDMVLLAFAAAIVAIGVGEGERLAHPQPSFNFPVIKK